MHTDRERGDIPYIMINPIYYYSGEVQCVHGNPPLPNVCHKIDYFANSFVIFTFSASHKKYYFKWLIEEGSNRTSPTIKGRSSIPTHTFNFCDTWEENETQTHMTQIDLAPAHKGGDGGVAECHETLRTVSHDMTVWHNQVTAGPVQNYVAAALPPCFKIVNLTLLLWTVSNFCLYLFQGL